MEVYYPSGIRQCDSTTFLFAIVAPLSWPAPGNKLPFGPLEQHCLSPGGHLRVSSTPWVGWRQARQLQWKLLVFQWVLCPAGIGGLSPLLAEGQQDLIVFYIAFPWWLLRLAPFLPLWPFGCPVMGKHAWDLAHSSRRQWLGGTMGQALHPQSCGFIRPHRKCPGPDMLTGLSHADTCNLP